jgi:hypothetical protein
MVLDQAGGAVRRRRDGPGFHELVGGSHHRAYDHPDHSAHPTPCPGPRATMLAAAAGHGRRWHYRRRRLPIETRLLTKQAVGISNAWHKQSGTANQPTTNLLPTFRRTNQPSTNQPTNQPSTNQPSTNQPTHPVGGGGGPPPPPHPPPTPHNPTRLPIPPHPPALPPFRHLFRFFALTCSVCEATSLKRKLA